MKLKIGDKRIIRSDLEIRKWYGTNDVAKSMLDYIGKEVVIVGFEYNGSCIIDLDNGDWSWTEEMFE